MTFWALEPGEHEYFTRHTRTRYHKEGSEEPGWWMGRGSEALGLSGDVETEQLGALFDGIDPRTKRKLVQNAGSSERVPAWDMTVSAPKSYSVFWSQSSEATRKVMDGCERQAAQAVVSYLESLNLARRGKGGHTSEQAGLVFGAFSHAESREGY